MKNIKKSSFTIPAGRGHISCELAFPEGTSSIVIFSHGSGSSRFSPRNNYVAGVLHENGIGTVLLDLLTKEEDQVYALRFDIGLLSDRLIQATNYITRLSNCAHCEFGYFGASTGAAAAFKAAGNLADRIRSVVSRGGRPDLAMSSAPLITAPTLLIVGELDNEVLELNRRFYDKLKCCKQLKIVDGATHLFEEPGALQAVAELSADWFSRYLQNKK